jgi:hypothetical protein
MDPQPPPYVPSEKQETSLLLELEKDVDMLKFENRILRARIDELREIVSKLIKE